MPKRRRLSAGEFTEVDSLDNMQVLSPILIRRNMQPHHSVNFASSHHTHHPLNVCHNSVNPFNHGVNHNLNSNCLTNQHFSINNSQQTPSHSSPLLFHSSVQQPQTQQSSQQIPHQTVHISQQQQQQHSSPLLNANNLLELVENNNLRFNQRSSNALHLQNSLDHCNNCNNLYFLNNSNSNNNNSQNGSNNINCINQNSNFLINYQRNNLQLQQNSPQRSSPSRHRSNNNRTRWTRYINNNYNNANQSNNSNGNVFNNLNRINNLVYSSALPSSLSSSLLTNNLNINNLNNLSNLNNLNNTNTQTTNSQNLFANTDNLFTTDNCANYNSVNNSVNSNNNYHVRRFQNISNLNGSRQRPRTTSNGINLNAFGLFNTSFVNSSYNPNLVTMPNTHGHHPASNSNDYFLNNATNNFVNVQHQLYLMLALFSADSPTMQAFQNASLQNLNPGIALQNLNVLNQLNPAFINQIASNSIPELVYHAFAHLNNRTNNHNYHQSQTFNHYANNHYPSYPNIPSSSSSTSSNATTSATSSANPQQVENYEALLNLAHRLGEAKTRGLSRAEIDSLPSYRYRTTVYSKSLRINSEMTLKGKHRCNKLMKLCKNHKVSKYVDANNSEEEENYDDLDDLENEETNEKQSITQDHKSKRSNLINPKLNLINVNNRDSNNVKTIEHDDQKDYCCHNGFTCEAVLEDENEKMCCVICMCDFELRQLLRVLPCNHEFHARCIDKWLKSNRTCPICRGDALIVSCESE